MRVSQVVRDIPQTIRQLVNALANRLHTADNFAPDGDEGQILTSVGKTSPPVWAGADVGLRAIPPAVLTQIIQGTPGAGGTPGPAGARGLAGPPGWDGIDGEEGLPGPMGAIGLTGATGAPGADGTLGAIGAMGPSGEDGPVGEDGFPGPTGPIGPVGPPGQDASTQGTYLISGGGVAALQNYDFRVSAAIYAIVGVQYSSPQTDVTLSVADATFNRFDIIVVDDTGTVVVLEGTPSANPELPDVDPTSQLVLTIIRVDALSSSPGVTTTVIYAENIEWTSAVSGASVNAGSTNNPFAGTKDIEFTAAAAGAFVSLTNTSAISLANSKQLVLLIRSKGAFPNPKKINVAWYNGASKIGQVATIANTRYGFVDSQTATYQQLIIPISDFLVPAIATVDSLVIAIIGGGAAIGFYLDNIVLEENTTTVGPPPVAKATVSISGTVKTDITDNDPRVYLKQTIDRLFIEKYPGFLALDGEQGEDGLIGPPGVAGAAGATGATGASGTGTQGPPGMDGEENEGSGFILIATPIPRSIDLSISGGGIALNLLGETAWRVSARTIGTFYRLVVIGQGGPGSATIQVKKCSLADFITSPTNLADITGSNNIVLTNVDGLLDETIAGWTKAVVPGDVVEFALLAVSIFTGLSISLEYM